MRWPSARPSSRNAAASIGDPAERQQRRLPAHRPRGQLHDRDLLQRRLDQAGVGQRRREAAPRPGPGGTPSPGTRCRCRRRRRVTTGPDVLGPPEADEQLVPERRRVGDELVDRVADDALRARAARASRAMAAAHAPRRSSRRSATPPTSLLCRICGEIDLDDDPRRPASRVEQVGVDAQPRRSTNRMRRRGRGRAPSEQLQPLGLEQDVAPVARRRRRRWR